MQLNQLNPAGMAQLAGNQTPRLDLPLFGNTATPNAPMLDAVKAKAVLDQQTMQNQMQLAQQYANMRQQSMLNLFDQQQANNRSTATNLSSQQNAQTMANSRVQDALMRNQLGYAQLGQTAQNNAVQQQIAQSQLGINQQNADQTGAYQQANITQKEAQLHAQQQTEAINQYLSMKKDKLQTIAGIGAGFATRFNMTQDPAEQNAAKQQALDQLKGLIPDDQWSSLSKMDINSFKQYSDSAMAALGNAAMIHATMPNVAQQGGQLIHGVDANGNPTVSMALPQKAKDAALTTIQEYTPIQKQLDSWISDWKPIYDTYAKETQGIVGNIEGKIGLGPTNSTQFIKTLAQAKSKLNGLVLNMASTLKNSRSPLVQQQLKEMLPNESDSPEAVEGKQQAIQTFVNNHMNEAKQSLQMGSIPLDQRSSEPVSYKGQESNTSTSSSSPKMIKVIQKSSGLVGQVPEGEYNDNDYKKV